MPLFHSELYYFYGVFIGLISGEMMRYFIKCRAETLIFNPQRCFFPSTSNDMFLNGASSILWETREKPLVSAAPVNINGFVNFFETVLPELLISASYLNVSSW